MPINDDSSIRSFFDTQDPSTGDSEPSSLGLPSYLVAADIHSIANNNQTFLESASETVSNIPKFIGVSILSGANQLYNIAPTLGNYLGGDFELSNSADVITSLDDDLGQYYEEHQESADIAGFLLSSLVPGLGGIKLLNAGQAALRTSIATGKFGKTTSQALGLLAPNRQKHLTRAISEITNSNSLSLITNKNTLRALGAGYGQGVLEAAAFETATSIALADSPVLVNQDVSDIITNIAIGGVIGGTISGVIDVTKSTFKVKNAVRASDAQANEFTQIKELNKGAPPASKFLTDLETADTAKRIPVGVLTPERQSFLETSQADVTRKLANRQRTSLNELAEGDTVIGSRAYSFGVGKDFETLLPEYLGATKISRIADTTPVESAVKRLKKKILSGKQSIDEGLELGAEIEAKNFKVSYSTTWGESLGNTTATPPQHIVLADTLKKGEEILVKGNRVKAGERSYNFSMKGIHPSPKSPVAKGTGSDITKLGLYEAQARHIWALELAPFVARKAKFKPVTINENDTALLDKLFREFDPAHSVALKDGTTRNFNDAEELLDFIHTKKVELANELLTTKAGKSLSQEDIASVLNIKSSRLSGVVSNNLEDDIFALQSYARDHTKSLVDKGLRRANEDVIPVYKTPRTIKTTYNTAKVEDLDGNIVEGMAVITQQERLQTERVERMSASYLAEDYDKLPPILARDVLGANRTGAGADLLSAASSNYGGLAALTEWIGKVTAGSMQKKQQLFRDTVDPVLYKLGQNPNAAVEWSTINATLRGTPMSYSLNEAGTALIPSTVKRYNALRIAAEEAGEDVAAIPQPKIKDLEAPREIPLSNSATREMAAAHIKTNGSRLEGINPLRTSQGMQSRLDPDSFYPVPVDPSTYPFFALVRDVSLTSTGKTKTLYATSDEHLEQIKRSLSGDPSIEVLTKTDAQNYYKSLGEYDQTRALNDNYLDSLVQRKGVSAPALVVTDPDKIAKEYINWGTKQENSVVREMVSAKYDRQFEELRQKGEAFTNNATSQFNNLALVKHAESVVKNPYMDYIKTALNVSKYSDYPFWQGANRLLDNKVSEMYNKLTSVLEAPKTAEQLTELNSTLKQYGYKGAAYTMEMDLLVNHTANKGVLQKFVQNANAILATTVLRLDHLNAVTNAISANILYGAEMKAVIRAIDRGDTNAVGELAALSKIQIPGTDKLINSPTKMMINAIKAFGKDSPDLKFFKEQGYVTSITDQYRSTLNNLTLTGTETAKDLSSKIDKVTSSIRAAADKGERWTGNRLAEEYNRFVAAHTMKQVTDIAVKAGVLDEKSALSYINTFVNRTQGNYLASQRPLLFQGAVGQSIGLFQTYQFNLMQQLLRHVGEGTAKDSATLLGLQGTVFGLNGLPAFNAINTHIIGTASGNPEHKDAYSTVYGAAGKNAGDWLMYGLASNMLLHPDLKTNLYVRGDINPRHVTLVPTDPASVPIVQATGKFLGNIINTIDVIGEGGDVSTALLQGLEHNGISRPLAGLAQTLEGINNPEHASYSTSKRGNVIASNDLLSLVNIARMVGGKPLGEAVAIDASYRFKTYALADNRKRSDLGQAIKTTLIAGQSPSQEQIEGFADSYAKLGGKQTEFNQWMLQLYKTANTSQANAIRDNLNSPLSKSMQLIMGGFELKDFNNN